MFVQQNSKEVSSKKLNHSQRATALFPLNQHSTVGQGAASGESRTCIPGTSGLSYAGHTFLALYEILKARQAAAVPNFYHLQTCGQLSVSLTMLREAESPSASKAAAGTGTEHLKGMSPGTSCKQTQAKTVC